MKILMLTWEYPPRVVGGISRVVYDLSKTLLKDGHDVTVVTYRDGDAPYFEDVKLLIAADCTAYAYANMHEEFMKGKITLIGCPKLDQIDYSEKLTQIIAENNIKSVTVLRMEVPCCGGLENAAVKALKNSGKFLPWQVVTISIDGRIL